MLGWERARDSEIYQNTDIVKVIHRSRPEEANGSGGEQLNSRVNLKLSHSLKFRRRSNSFFPFSRLRRL